MSLRHKWKNDYRERDQLPATIPSLTLPLRPQVGCTPAAGSPHHPSQLRSIRTNSSVRAAVRATRGFDLRIYRSSPRQEQLQAEGPEYHRPDTDHGRAPKDCWSPLPFTTPSMPASLPTTLHSSPSSQKALQYPTNRHRPSSAKKMMQTYPSRASPSIHPPVSLRLHHIHHLLIGG